MQIFRLSSNGWRIFKELHLEALREDLEAFGSSYEESNKRTEEEWKEKAGDPNSYVLVGQKSEDTVGIAEAYRKQGKKVNHIAEIRGVYVRKLHRGDGRGKELMEALLNRLTLNEEIKKVSLTVNTSRQPAVELYLSLGFEIVGVLHGELKVGEKYFDEYVMEKFL